MNGSPYLAASVPLFLPQIETVGGLLSCTEVRKTILYVFVKGNLYNCRGGTSLKKYKEEHSSV